MRRILTLTFPHEKVATVRNITRSLNLHTVNHGMLTQPIEGFVDIQFDDSQETPKEVAGRVRLAMGILSEFFLIAIARCSVCVPDGGPSDEWYAKVDPMCLELERLEEAITGDDATADDLDALAKARAALEPLIEEGILAHRRMLVEVLDEIEASAVVGEG